jgi:hypothetical protein
MCEVFLDTPLHIYIHNIRQRCSLIEQRASIDRKKTGGAKRWNTKQNGGAIHGKRERENDVIVRYVRKFVSIK